MNRLQLGRSGWGAAGIAGGRTGWDRPGESSRCASQGAKLKLVALGSWNCSGKLLGLWCHGQASRKRRERKRPHGKTAGSRCGSAGSPPGVSHPLRLLHVLWALCLAPLCRWRCRGLALGSPDPRASCAYASSGLQAPSPRSPGAPRSGTILSLPWFSRAPLVSSNELFILQHLQGGGDTAQRGLWGLAPAPDVLRHLRKQRFCGVPGLFVRKAPCHRVLQDSASGRRDLKHKRYLRSSFLSVFCYESFVPIKDCGDTKPALLCGSAWCSRTAVTGFPRGRVSGTAHSRVPGEPRRCCSSSSAEWLGAAARCLLREGLEQLSR